MFPAQAHPLLARLEGIATLTSAEKQAIRDLPMLVQDIRANQDVVREGDRPTRCFLLLEGFTCTFKVTESGKRQIMAFHIPGDISDLQSLHMETLDHTVGTITPCKVGFIAHEALRDLCRRHDGLNDALWRETLIDAAIFRQWMIGLGRKDAFARLCHFLCEMVVRLRAVGLVEDHTCDLPITQTELGDALGLSTVHINRTMQAIRQAELISLTGNKLMVLDWQELKRAGEFDPTYLRIKREGTTR